VINIYLIYLRYTLQILHDLNYTPTNLGVQKLHLGVLEQVTRPFLKCSVFLNMTRIVFTTMFMLVAILTLTDYTLSFAYIM
jgi:hypothetical protein